MFNLSAQCVVLMRRTFGRRFIKHAFGAEALPRVGWQLDGFGHSATHASLLTADAGYDALVYSRMHPEVRSHIPLFGMSRYMQHATCSMQYAA